MTHRGTERHETWLKVATLSTAPRTRRRTGLLLVATVIVTNPSRLLGSRGSMSGRHRLKKDSLLEWGIRHGR